MKYTTKHDHITLILHFISRKCELLFLYFYYFVADHEIDRDTLIEQSLTLIEQSLTLIEQSLSEKAD